VETAVDDGGNDDAVDSEKKYVHDEDDNEDDKATGADAVEEGDDTDEEGGALSRDSSAEWWVSDGDDELNDAVEQVESNEATDVSTGTMAGADSRAATEAKESKGDDPRTSKEVGIDESSVVVVASDVLVEDVEAV
jgi:hypothetical protein